MTTEDGREDWIAHSEWLAMVAREAQLRSRRLSRRLLWAYMIGALGWILAGVFWVLCMAFLMAR